MHSNNIVTTFFDIFNKEKEEVQDVDTISEVPDVYELVDELPGDKELEGDEPINLEIHIVSPESMSLEREEKDKESDSDEKKNS